MPGHPKILAKDLVELHRQQTVEQFDVPVHLETTADSISWEDDLVVLHTDKRRPALAHGRSSPAGTAPSSPRSCPTTT